MHSIVKDLDASRLQTERMFKEGDKLEIAGTTKKARARPKVRCVRKAVTRKGKTASAGGSFWISSKEAA